MSTRNGRLWRGIGSILAAGALVAGCGGGGNPDSASSLLAEGRVALQHELTAGDQQSPRIAPLAGGGYLVAWLSGGSNYTQRYDAQGEKVGGPTSIGPATAITGLRDGGYMVGYAAYTYESTPYYVADTRSIALQSYSADGMLLSGRTLDSATSRWNYPFYYSQRPAYRSLWGLSFGYLDEGGFATWNEEYSYGSSYRIPHDTA